MTTINLIKGLSLLQHYYSSENRYNTSAEHDVLYAHSTDVPLPSRALQEMVSLGWHQETDNRNYDEDYSVKDYDPEESWMFYT